MGSQVKKSPKWVCKICQEKQTTKHVYCSGSGAQCRKVVQDLNWKRMELNNAKEEEVFKHDMGEEDFLQQADDIENVFVKGNDDDDGVHPYSSSGSRWTAFIPPPPPTTTVVHRLDKGEIDKTSEDSFEEPFAKKPRIQGLQTIKASGNNKPALDSHKISTNAHKIQPMQSKWSRFVS